MLLAAFSSGLWQLREGSQVAEANSRREEPGGQNMARSSWMPMYL